MKYKLLILLISFSCVNKAAAQINTSDTTQQQVLLEPLIIQSTKLTSRDVLTPFSVSKVSRKRIQLGRKQVNIKNALETVPGVFILNGENYAQDLRVSIRGFGARSSFGIRGVQVLVDGIPESTPDGQAQVDNIDAGILENIEVVRGPSAALFGNAAGGALYLSTEDVNQPFTSVRSTFGSFGLQRYQLKSGLKNEKVSNLFYAAYTNLDGYRNRSATENFFMNNKTQFDVSEKSRITLLLNYANHPKAEDPGGLTLEEAETNPKMARTLNAQQQTGEEVIQGRAGLIFDHKIDTDQQLAGKVYHTFRNFEGFIPFSVIQFDRSFTGASFEYKRSYAINEIKMRLVTGMDYKLQRDERFNFENNEGIKGAETLNQIEKFNNTAFYILNEIQPLDKLYFTLSGRFDFMQLEADDRFLDDGNQSGSRTYNQLNPMLGVVYDINGATQLYSNFSSSFETPTLNELSNNPNGLGGFNPDLKPQRAINAEIGLRTEIQYLQLQASFFRINVENELVAYELGQFPDREFYENSGQSIRNGLELSLRYSQGPFSLFSAYTFSNFKFERFESGTEDFTGNLLPGIPKHQYYQELRFETSEGFYAVLDGRLTGKLYADNLNTTQIDAFAVINSAIGYTMEMKRSSIEIFGGVNNLTNTSYYGNIRINAFGQRYYEPAAPINFYGGISLHMDY